MKFCNTFFVLFLWIGLSAQVDSFYYDHTKYYTSPPDEWVLVSSSDTAGIEGDQIYRHPVYDECSYAFISVQFENRNRQVKGPKFRTRKFSGKYFDVGQFHCINFYSDPSSGKIKCKNRKYISGYIHRINDSLDLVFTLSCLANKKNYGQLDALLLNYASSFFDLNGDAIIRLKGYRNISWEVDTITISGNHLYVPFCPLWTAVEKTDSSVSYSMSSINDCHAPLITVYPSVHHPFDPIRRLKTDDKNFFRRLFPEAHLDDQRVDTMMAHCINKHYDTVSYATLVHQVICNRPSQAICYYNSLVVVLSTGVEKIEIELQVPYDDGVSSIYGCEQFEFFLEHIRQWNSFGNWK